jgi:hypothetical protein
METLDASKLVTVETFQNEIEAQIAQGRLKSEGIKSFIFKDDIGGTTPGMQFALGVELRVRQIDFARATDTLKSFGDSGRKPEELKPGENKAAVYSFLAWPLSIIGCIFLVISISLGRAEFIIGTIILFAGILFGVSSRTIKKKIEKKKST